MAAGGIDVVLRGSACGNFFPATARWQFSGVRLARS